MKERGIERGKSPVAILIKSFNSIFTVQQTALFLKVRVNRFYYSKEKYINIYAK